MCRFCALLITKKNIHYYDNITSWSKVVLLYSLSRRCHILLCPPPLLSISTSGDDNESMQCKRKIMIQQFKKTQVDYVFGSTALHCDPPSATVQHTESLISACDASLCCKAHHVFAENHCNRFAKSDLMVEAYLCFVFLSFLGQMMHLVAFQLPEMTVKEVFLLIVLLQLYTRLTPGHCLSSHISPTLTLPPSLSVFLWSCTTSAYSTASM